MQMLWLTALDSSETVGVPMSRIALIEQKSPREGHAVALHLDTGKEIRVMEGLGEIRDMLAQVSIE
ncbi:MAG: hypothetical protein AB8B85_06075 [Paracoccaceae bacterium]